MKRLISQTGQIVLSKIVNSSNSSILEVELSEIPSRNYYLKFTSDKGLVTKKIVEL